MSSKRCLLCFLLMLFCVCAAWSRESKQIEIPLVSSDFTTGVVIDPGWSIGRATAEVVQEGASAGRYCLRIAATKGENPWDSQLTHKRRVLRKGKAYTLAAYLKSPEKLQINLTCQLAEDPWTGYGGQSFTMTDTWQEYHITTPPMPDDVSPARFYFHFAYDTGEFYIDSVRFYEGEYVPYKPEGMGQIEGRLMMLDDKTPHVAIPVQAICDGEVIASTLSDDKGIYRFMILKPGEYQLRCQVLGGYVYYQKSGEAGAEEQRDGDVLQIKDGVTPKNVDFRFAPFKKGNWRNYDQTDGLAHPSVTSIYRAPNGEMWFGTGAFIIGGEGVSRYDGRGFINFTAEDGLASNWITAIHGAPDGAIWFGTEASGVSRYDGKSFTSFTTVDGLVSNHINAILCDGQGVTWFGTDNGVSRYDGTGFDNPLTGENRLASSNVRAIHRDPDGVMWFGTDGGVYRYDGNRLATFSQKDGLLHNVIGAIYRSPDGIMWFGTNGGVYRYDGREFANFATRDGLVHNVVRAIYCDRDGVMWFGTDGGVSRYDGVTFVNFTIEDGLIYNVITSIQGAADGTIWFGATGSWPGGGGISRYDEKGFANFTTEDGLTHNHVLDIHFSRDGIMWVGTRGGVARYDGRQFYSFATPTGDTRSVNSDSDGTIWAGTFDGCFRYTGRSFVPFMNGNVVDIYRAPDDSMWVATWNFSRYPEIRGLYRYHGEEAFHFTKEKDGLADDSFAVGRVIDTDADSMVWLGTWGGISRYDGARLHEPLTQEHGLADNRIAAVCCAENGMVWFGTMDGLSRYDGKGFTNFTNKDGLASNEVRAIHFSADGIMWCGTSSGVSLYDGNAWSSLDTRDGLAGNHVVSIQQDSEGFIWLGTEGGLTRYRRDNTPPYAQIVSLTADQTYTDLSTVPDFSVGTRVTIEYKSIDLKTLPGKHQYRCRIYKTQDSRPKTQDEELRIQDNLESRVINPGSSEAYNPPTRDTTFDWIPKEPGGYIFEVQAIDRDLNYSEPANLTLRVVRPFYLRAVFLVPTIGSGMFVLAIVVFLATALTKRRRQVHAYQQLAVRELRDARDMQMALLPEVAPPFEGMEIAGRSIPANTVGGDFFDYITLADGKVGVALADISGKGLRAAMNAVMTSGMLYEVVKTEMSCGNILSALNAGLYPRMEEQTFAAFSFAILDQNAGVIQWSNAAQPLPMIKRGDGVSEAQAGGELPLGMAPDVRYPDHQLKLQAGDIVILYTDGIIEAENEAEEMYGTERLLHLVTGIDSAANAEDVIEAILQDVARFAGDAERYDDMTVVVVKKYP